MATTAEKEQGKTQPDPNVKDLAQTDAAGMPGSGNNGRVAAIQELANGVQQVTLVVNIPGGKLKGNDMVSVSIES